MGTPATPEFREVRNYLQDVASEQTRLDQIPAALARALGNTSLTPDEKRTALKTIRDWVNYTNDENVPNENPFAIRYHIPKFAGLLEAGEPSAPAPLFEMDVNTLFCNGRNFADILSDKTSSNILSDPEVAVVGGAARLALKIHAGVDSSSELPLNDIDAVISSSANSVTEVAERYGIDLSGAKIVDGDIREKLGTLVNNFDCTMNQVGIHDGKLLFTDVALRDIKDGNIRLIAKNDLLFGSEGETLPDGNIYLNRTGFYRGLGFLLRNKGERLIVSQENIEREKDEIGRYWQVLLYVKLLPMEDELAKYNAIGNWHDIARRLGSTETESPKEFLEQLIIEYPSTASGKGANYDSTAQARWIVGKMIVRGLERIYHVDRFVAPSTYTEANISLSPNFRDYDYLEFMSYVDNVRSS